MASGAFSWAPGSLDWFSRSVGGSRIPWFLALVSGQFSECPKPAKPCMDVQDCFRFFCGVRCNFVSSGFVGQILCVPWFRFWSFLKLVSGQFSECPKPVENPRSRVWTFEISSVFSVASGALS